MLFDTVIDYYAIPGIHEEQMFYILKEYQPQSMEDITKHLSKIRECEALPDKNKNIDCLSKSLDWLDETLQHLLSRPPSIERHMLNDIPIEMKHKLVPILQPAFGDSINLDANPNKIILYGAFEASMIKRIELLQKILERKNEQEKSLAEVFVLVGARDLWPIDEKATEVLVIEQLTQTGKYVTKDAKEIVDKGFANFFGTLAIKIGSTKNLKPEEIIKARLDIIQHFQTIYGIKWPTETDMAKKIISTNKFLKNLNIHFVVAPKKPNGERPDTKSTLELWWQENGTRLQQEAEGKLEVYTISNQPHAIYQLEQAKFFAFEKQLSNLKFKVIANSVDLMQDRHCSAALNNLYRIIFYGKEMVKIKIKNIDQTNK